MNRFSVIYLHAKQYYHIHCKTHSEANSVLEHLFTLEDHAPIGIYDAKTELFYWEAIRQHQYNQASIEEQGKLDKEITSLAQNLRQLTEIESEDSDTIKWLVDVSH